MNGSYLGDYADDATVDFKWSTYSAAGASITRGTDGTVSVYVGNSTTQLTTGVTDTEDFDSLTGIHHCRIDLSASATYTPGVECQVVLSAAAIDGQTVNAVLAHFSIERAGGALAVAKARLPTTLVSGRIDASVGAMASGVVTATAIAADAIGASELAADAATEIATAVWAAATRSLTILDEDSTTLDLDATIRTAVGLASADLDTQLGLIDNAVDDIPDLLAGVLLAEIQAAVLSTTQVATDLVGYADDALVGRSITFIDGDCAGQARTITDYAEADGVITFAALTTVPADGDRVKVA